MNLFSRENTGNVPQFFLLTEPRKVRCCVLVCLLACYILQFNGIIFCSTFSFSIVFQMPSSLWQKFKDPYHPFTHFVVFLNGKHVWFLYPSLIKPTFHVFNDRQIICHVLSKLIASYPLQNTSAKQKHRLCYVNSCMFYKVSKNTFRELRVPSPTSVNTYFYASM